MEPVADYSRRHLKDYPFPVHSLLPCFQPLFHRIVCSSLKSQKWRDPIGVFVQLEIERSGLHGLFTELASAKAIYNK